ncbi:MAG: hypothetical protein MHM6MM_002768 [Cercozoa sp. M6MM]
MVPDGETGDMVPNPEFVPWQAPRIPNPDFVKYDQVHHHEIHGVGIDVWQVKAGTVFEELLITHSEEEAKQAREKRFSREAMQAEKNMKASHEAKKADEEDEEETNGDSDDSDIEENDIDIDVDAGSDHSDL